MYMYTFTGYQRADRSVQEERLPLSSRSGGSQTAIHHAMYCV